MERNLPTDEEFLDSLFQAPASGTHVETPLDPEFVRDATNLLRGAFPATTDLDRYVTDMFDLAKAFRGAALAGHVAHGAPSTTDTHPSARDRWHRLRDSSELKDGDEKHVGLIDSMFDMILRVQPDFIKC